MPDSPYSAEQMRAFLETATEGSAFTSYMGTEIRRFEPGVVEIAVVLRPELTQHHGYAHGAVLGYLADTALAWAAASVAGDVVTAEYKINFLAPAKGERLWARAEVLRAGKRNVVARADVYAHSGGADTLVATALGTVAPVARQA